MLVGTAQNADLVPAQHKKLIKQMVCRKWEACLYERKISGEMESIVALCLALISYGGPGLNSQQE